MLQIFRTKFHEAFQVIFVDDKDKNRSLSSTTKLLFSRRSVKYQRFLALIQLVNLVLPNWLKDKLAGYFMYTQKYMPLCPDKYQLGAKIGKGESYNVFLLESYDKNITPMVLKIYRRSKGVSTQQLLELVNVQNNQYDMLSHIYKNIEGFILDEYYIILHGPDQGKPVVGMLQPFISEKIRDVFEDFSEKDLKELINKNNDLKQQFVDFVTITKANPSVIVNELDIIGTNNLAIIGQNNDMHLKLLDPHFRTSGLNKINKQNEISQKIKYLEDLLKAS